MTSIRRGTTPKITIDLNNVFYSDIKSGKLSIEQNTNKYNFDITINTDGLTGYVKLTQAQTLLLEVGDATMQVKVITNDGDVLASDIAPISITDIIDEEILNV